MSGVGPNVFTLKDLSSDRLELALKQRRPQKAPYFLWLGSRKSSGNPFGRGFTIKPVAIKVGAKIYEFPLFVPDLHSIDWKERDFKLTDPSLGKEVINASLMALAMKALTGLSLRSSMVAYAGAKLLCLATKPVKDLKSNELRDIIFGLCSSLRLLNLESESEKASFALHLHHVHPSKWWNIGHDSALKQRLGGVYQFVYISFLSMTDPQFLIENWRDIRSQLSSVGVGAIEDYEISMMKLYAGVKCRNHSVVAEESAVLRGRDGFRKCPLLKTLETDFLNSCPQKLGGSNG
tara:strand:+ start:201 stop:1076 length:876 start_codon:yes stop_codon:yes gene_type:complete